MALAAFWGVRGYTRGVENLGGVQGGDQHLNLLLVLQADDPSLFSRDLVFGGSSLAGDYIPLYIGLLRLAYHAFGDLAAGYKLLIFPMTLLYLCGAYLVFLRFSQRAWVATALSAFSSLPLGIVLADEIFGIGPITLMVARTIVTAAFPLLFAAFCAWMDRPGRLVLLFLGIGLLANLHPVSALDIAAIFAVSYLLERRGDGRGWLAVAGMGAAALAGAAPIAWSQLQHVARQAALAARADQAAVAQVAAERLGFIMYPPHSLSALPPVVAHALTLGVLALSVAPVLCGWRRPGGPGGLSLRLAAALSAAYLLFPEVRLLAALPVVAFLLARQDASPREERLAAYFSLSILWITLAELLVFQFGPGWLNRPLLSVVATRGARFSVFAVYLLLALAVRLADWSRVRGMLRLACILLLVFTAFWQVRHTVRTHLRTREDLAAADLAAMARWARQETRPDDLFLFDSAAFRVLARRPLVFATKDGDAAVASRPDRAAAWLERQATLAAARRNPEELWAAGVRYGAEYVVVPAHDLGMPVRFDRVRYRNATFVVLATSGSGLSVGATGSRGS